MPPFNRPPMPTHIARLSGAKARERLHQIATVRRDPDLDPGVKLTLLAIMEVYDEQGLEPFSVPLVIEEDSGGATELVWTGGDLFGRSRT